MAEIQPMKPDLDFDLTAESAVLIEGSSGQLLFEKNAHQIRPPASTTKMLTALVALEWGTLSDPVTIGPRVPRTTGSKLGLKVGQVYPLEELLEGALIPSGNDACIAIGEHIGGNEALFLKMMNLKAISLGAKNTFFQNTNGLPAKDHYSSAYDLALIARYALSNPEFAKIVSSQFAKVSPVLDKEGLNAAKAREIDIKNTNALLWNYPGANGVKTGTTFAAGACLVASATRDGRQLIAVVLKSRNRFKDAAKLLDLGFENYSRVEVLPAGEVVTTASVKRGNPDWVEVAASESLGITLPNWQASQVKRILKFDDNLCAPLTAGTPVGEIVLSYQGIELQKAKLVTVQAVAKTVFWWKW